MDVYLSLILSMQDKRVLDEGGAPRAAAAVVAVVVSAWEVGRGHEWVALIWAAILQ